MTTIDAIIIDNLLPQTLEISYTLPTGIGKLTLDPSGTIILQGIRLEQLAENIRLVHIPKKYVKVKKYDTETYFKHPIHWFLSGFESRCLSIDGVTGGSSGSGVLGVVILGTTFYLNGVGASGDPIRFNGKISKTANSTANITSAGMPITSVTSVLGTGILGTPFVLGA